MQARGVCESALFKFDFKLLFEQLVPTVFIRPTKFRVAAFGSLDRTQNRFRPPRIFEPHLLFDQLVILTVVFEIQLFAPLDGVLCVLNRHRFSLPPIQLLQGFAQAR